jgi:iron complex transport system ATP-binding protein
MVTGVPEDLVLDGSFESVFSKSGFYFDRSSGTFSLGMGKFRLMVNLNGSPDLIFWTKRALMREGIASQPDCDSHYRIIASENQNLKTWTLEHLGTISQYYTIGDLINSLTSAGLYVK